MPESANHTETTQKRVLVLGGSGLLGTALCFALDKAGHRVEAPTRAVLDLDEALQADSAALADAVAKADYVVNAAYAKGSPALSPKTTRRLNVLLPHRLADLCGAQGARLIHISSDGVFSGRAAPYDEGRTPDATDPYGREKIAGEPVGALILRSSVIGPEQRGFTSLFCWLMQQDKPITGFDNHWWNGLTSPAYAQVITKIISEDLWLPGLRHLHSAPAMHKGDLLRALAAAFAKPIDITSRPAPTPRDLRLRSGFPEFLAAMAIPPLAEQIADLPRFSTSQGNWQAPTAE